MKTLKKLLLTVFAFSSAVLCTTAFAACGEHEHNWGEWTETPATCTEAGLKEHFCQDDPTHTESFVINATGHAFGEWEVTSAATCTDKAVETRVCANDENHTETREVGEPLGHKWELTADTATCGAAGEKTFTCSVTGCGETKTEASEALNHDWGEWEQTSAATCASKAVETRVCANDKTHKETREVGELLNHAWGEWEQTSAATCAAKAVETRICANDENHTETREVGELLNHDWGEWEVTTPAKCTAKAVETRICANDKTHKETREVGEPLGHKWVQTSNTATCTAAGEKTLTCMRNGCGEMKTEASEALNHAWGAWKVTTPATCTSKAVETRVCANGETHKETREVGEPLDHDWGEWTVTTPSTCLTAGEETRICANDNTHKETRDADPLGHDWGEWTVTTPSTCLTAGEETRVCANDNTHKETRDADPLGHDWGEWTVTTPSTCLTAGEETRVCANDNTHKETTPLALADHAWNDGEVTTEPGEYTPGVKTFTCTVDGCGATKTEPIAELGHTHDFDVDWSTDGENHWKECAGASCTEKVQSAAHDWDDGEVTTEPGCTEAGVKTYTCTVCDKTKTEEIEPAHALEKTEASDPTCTKNGNTEYWSCSECDKLFSDENAENEVTRVQTIISTPGHGWNDGEVTTNPTCTEKGVKTFLCTVCGSSKTEQIAANGHSYEYDLVTAPGFTTNGTAVRTCSECDLDEEVNLLSINMMGSSYSFVETTPATCEEEGARTYTIPLQGGSVTFDIAVPAIAHKNTTQVAASKEPKTLVTNAGTQLTFNNKAYYLCPDCGMMYYDANRTYEVTATLAYGRYGVLISIGENKIYKTYGNGNIFFQAQADSLYTFKFANAKDANGNTIDYTVSSISYLIDETGSPVSVYAGKAWKTTAAAYSQFENTTETPTDTVTVNMKRGECIVLYNTTPTWHTVTVESDVKLIDFGENEIEITEANATHSTSEDSYVFVPSETKTYSITVPAGITVLMDGNDIVSANETSAFVNFEATQYKAVTFTFIGNAVGKYKVTIGGEIGYTLKLDNEVSFNIVIGKVIGVRIGDIPEGAYKIKITGGMLIAKQTGWGTMFMSLNGESDFETVTTNGLYLQANAENQNENLSSNSKSNPWIITATLQAGDMLYFASNPAWSNLPEGKELGDIIITLEAVE